MAIAADVINVVIALLEVWAFFLALFVAFLCWLAWTVRDRPLAPVQEELQELEDAWIGFDVARANHPVTASVSMDRRAA